MLYGQRWQKSKNCNIFSELKPTINLINRSKIKWENRLNKLGCLKYLLQIERRERLNRKCWAENGKKLLFLIQTCIQILGFIQSVCFFIWETINHTEHNRQLAKLYTMRDGQNLFDFSIVFLIKFQLIRCIWIVVNKINLYAPAK